MSLLFFFCTLLSVLLLLLLSWRLKVCEVARSGPHSSSAHMHAKSMLQWVNGAHPPQCGQRTLGSV
eukprot:2489083-Amphidinium_carterae.1